MIKCNACTYAGRFDRIEGIKSTVVGYAGGKTPFPTYKSIQDYTEVEWARVSLYLHNVFTFNKSLYYLLHIYTVIKAIRVEYDPKVLSFEQILEKFFDMQGGPPAYGSFSRQYRSAVLYHNAEQKAVVDSIFNKYAKETG